MIFSEFLKSLVLGVIQGLSEFLPISSSGHLVLTSLLFDTSGFNLRFILVLHLGSLMAILSYYYTNLLSIFKQFVRQPFSLSGENQLVYLVLIASLPSLPGAFLLNSLIEKSLSQVCWTGYGFLFTASCLFLTRWVLKRDSTNEKTVSSSPPPTSQNTIHSQSIHYFSFKKAFIIGLAQVLAFFPGMSRSGWTISTALFLGLPKKQAVFFSFLMAIPAICGALIFELYQKGLPIINGITLISLITAFFSAWLFGYIALKWVICSIQNLYFPTFAFYLWPLGLIIIMKDLL